MLTVATIDNAELDTNWKLATAKAANTLFGLVETFTSGLPCGMVAIWAHELSNTMCSSHLQGVQHGVLQRHMQSCHMHACYSCSIMAVRGCSVA